MVETLDRPQTGDTDRFIDWMYQLTGVLVTQAGLNERQASTAIATVVKEIQAEYPATRVYIHSAAGNSKQESRKKQTQVLGLWAKGFTTQKIAIRLQCSEKTVNRIIAAQRNQQD